MTDITWADGDQARDQLGRVGVWLSPIGRVPWREGAAAAARIETLGYGALWLGETPWQPEPLALSALLLGATERLSVATGIASIWTRDAIAARNGALALGAAHPGRFTLGLGVSHAPAVELRGQDYNKPLSGMRAYLDGFGAADYLAPLPEVPVPVVLAALRPKMLELARDRTAGAHPYFTPVEHTAIARERLGAGPILAPEVAIVLDADAGAARERARSYMKQYLALPNYTNNLIDLGWSEDDLADGGSDALVDAIVGWGDATRVAAFVRAHLDAGADHVAVQPVATTVAGAVAELEALAPLLMA